MGATFDKLLGELLLHKHKDQDISDFTVLDARYIGANDDIPYTQLADGVDGNLITWDTDGVPALVETGDAGQVLTSNGAGTAPTFQAAGGGGASTALDNLASVAINASLISDTDSTYDLGSSAKFWNNAYLGKIYTLETGTTSGVATGGAGLVIEKAATNNVGVSVLISNNKRGGLYITDTADNDRCKFEYNAYADILGININGIGIVSASNTLWTHRGDIRPQSDSTYDLGTSANYWAEGYFDKLYLNSTATLDGATAGQVNITGTIVNANIPTADPSVVGALWSDGGIVKVSAG